MGRLLVVLALAALACMDSGVRPGVTISVADSADQRIIGMSTRVFEDGVYRSHVIADTAFVYQARSEMDLRQLKVFFFDEQGNQTSTLSARRGIYTTTDGSLDAWGGVLVESTEGKRLRTEHLIYDKALLRIRSDTTFVYTSATETLSGVAFESDLDFRNVQIDKPRGYQKGEGVRLPEQ